MKLTSYWLDTSQSFDQGSFKPLEGRYDVAVVGGGLTGSSAMLALAKKGARLALLGAQTICNAASDRNSDMRNNGFAPNYGVMDGCPDRNPGTISTGRRSPDTSGVPGSCRSSAPTTG